MISMPLAAIARDSQRLRPGAERRVRVVTESSELGLSCAVRGHDKQLSIPSSGAIAREDDLESVWTRRGVRVVAGRIRQVRLIRAVRIHFKDLKHPASIALKEDRPVWHEGGRAIRKCVAGQPCLSRPIEVHDIDLGIAISVALEHDLGVAYVKVRESVSERVIG